MCVLFIKKGEEMPRSIYKGRRVCVYHKTYRCQIKTNERSGGNAVARRKEREGEEDDDDDDGLV